ncbi:glycoside hydrolase family 15 protein [Luteolibacter algae]
MPKTLDKETRAEIDRSLNDSYPPIEDYGIIGDLRTTALVGRNGSIDFMCFPEFDSPSIFCANTDRVKGGRFQIRPLLEEMNEKQLYLPDTNVLITRFLSTEGVGEISNYMVLSADEGPCEQALVRRAKCVIGEVSFRLLFAPRFDYARARHKVTAECENCLLFESEGSDGLKLRLHSSVPLEILENDGYAEFTLKAGEHATFTMEEAGAERDSRCGNEEYSSDSFKKTCDYWRAWIARCTYDGRWREAVHRSALALKLLTSKKHGSVIAAPCFGFPNEVGGVRNWDYRYTWLRDASFSTYALMRIGYTEEAQAFTNWLENRIKELGDDEVLQIMYRIDGTKLDGEFHLDQLEGYMHSKPIRIGSTNHDQIQLDIFGEVMDSVYLCDKYGSPISRDLWMNLQRLIAYVCDHWRDKDAGIWEIRGGHREFLYSRVMCWVALDRAIRLASKRGLPAPTALWQENRNAIYHAVFENFWDEEQGAFVQSKGSTALDASALIMPLVRFISPTDPRWLSCLKAIENDLVEDSLVHRYHVGEAFSDELEGKEGSFSICSFWYIECISRSGDVQKARLMFEKMLGYSNHLGLFSEQLGKKGEFLGNIPQAFTHLAMISAAFDLDRRLSMHPSRRVRGGLG